MKLTTIDRQLLGRMISIAEARGTREDVARLTRIDQWGDYIAEYKHAICGTTKGDVIDRDTWIVLDGQQARTVANVYFLYILGENPHTV